MKRKTATDSKRQVLILEDEELAANKMKAHLQRFYEEAVEITWVQSVGEGIRYLQENSPDLILSDIELLDGRAFIIYEHI